MIQVIESEYKIWISIKDKKAIGIGWGEMLNKEKFENNEQINNRITDYLNDALRLHTSVSHPVEPEVSRDCARLFYIISEKDILQKKTYYHVEKLFQTDKFIKYKFVDSNYIQVLPVAEFEKKYTVEETLVRNSG